METKRTINSITKYCLDEISGIFSQFSELNNYEESSIKGTLNALYNLGRKKQISLIDSFTIVNYLKFIDCNPIIIDKIQQYLSVLNKRRILTGYNVDYSTKQQINELNSKINSKELSIEIIEY